MALLAHRYTSLTAPPLTFLVVLGCVSMVLISVAAGVRAGCVTVVYGGGR